jgi:prophage maintenance system killer protein
MRRRLHIAGTDALSIALPNSMAGANAAITFLHLNDIEPTFDEDALVTLVLGVPQGQISKEEISKFFGANTRPLR